MSSKLHRCRHAVRLVDSFEDKRNIYVVQELCSGGDLADLMTVRQQASRQGSGLEHHC